MLTENSYNIEQFSRIQKKHHSSREATSIWPKKSIRFFENNVYTGVTALRYIFCIGEKQQLRSFINQYNLYGMLKLGMLRPGRYFVLRQRKK